MKPRPVPAQPKEQSRARRAALSLALVLPIFPALAGELPPAVHSLSLAPRRDYGIVMGETLSCEIRVAVESGFVLETASLPRPGGAVNDFLEVREAALDQQAAPGETVYRVRLVYQIFKGVREAETLAVPALPLRFSRAGQTVEAQAPAWNFTLAPIIPAQTPDEEVVLRGDLPAPALAGKRHWFWFGACLAGLAGLGACAGWRLGLLRRRAPPFVQAARALKKLGGQPPSPALWRQGARLVHAALNQTAGQVLLSGQLPGFLAARPAYAAARAELERFFEVSDRLFFGGAADYPADYPLARLEALCRELAAIGGGR